MRVPRATWGYTGLRVRDVARSIRFYEKLGFRVTRRGMMEHGGRWIDLARPGSHHGLELNYYPTTSRFYEPFRTGSEFDHFGFRVGDIGAWVRLLRRRHLPIVADFRETTQRLVYTRDPDGNWVEFYGPLERKPASRRRRA